MLKDLILSLVSHGVCYLIVLLSLGLHCLHAAAEAPLTSEQAHLPLPSQRLH